MRPDVFDIWNRNLDAMATDNARRARAREDSRSAFAMADRLHALAASCLVPAQARRLRAEADAEDDAGVMLSRAGGHA